MIKKKMVVKRLFRVIGNNVELFIGNQLKDLKKQGGLSTLLDIFDFYRKCSCRTPFGHVCRTGFGGYVSQICTKMSSSVGLYHSIGPLEKPYPFPEKKI